VARKVGRVVRKVARRKKIKDMAGGGMPEE